MHNLNTEKWVDWLLSTGHEPAHRDYEYRRPDCPACGTGKTHNPSRVMASATGAVNCFGCGHGYSALRWYMLVENVPYHVAKRALTSPPLHVDWTLPWQAPAARRQQRALDLPFEVYRGQELSGWQLAAAQAVERRGFPPQACLEYGMGFGTTGLWRNRVVLPVYDHGVLAWAQGWDYTRTEQVKYLAPRLGEGYARHECLYWGHFLTQSLPVLVLVEGVFNAWACHQVGFAATATFGKAVSDQQFDRFLAGNNQLFLVAFDADASQQAENLAARLRGCFRHARVLQLPDSRDLNDYGLADRHRLLTAALA